MRFLLASIAALGLLQTSSARPASADSVTTPHLTLSASVDAGATAAPRLVVDITPKPTMHVYAPGEKDAIPIAIELDPNPAIKAGKPVYPAPQKYFFPPL